MCGLLGIVARPNRFSEKMVTRALHLLHHRGPDDTGVERVTIGDWEVWLGHKRLAILDLSPQGHQPMFGQARDGARGWVVYNGETYNFKQLKDELRRTWEFKSSSDTEVVLAGLLAEGPAYLNRLNGMMALGLLDVRERTLLLARDRLGKKPLYVYSSDDLVVFASELKAISALGIELTTNPEAIAYYKWLGYIPARLSVYNECTKVPAGTLLKLDLNQHRLKPMKEEQYWDPLAGYAQPFKGTYEDAVEGFLHLLDDATRIRLLADVPVGVFLSGGVDSSLVVSSIQKVEPERVTAFTVKFEDPRFDESPIAVETARHLGAKIEVLRLEKADYEKQIPKIAFHYDEPFSDSSQIPTLAIAEAARKTSTVVLTGDGGDEIFLGYPRYLYPPKLDRLRRLATFIPGLGRAIASGLRHRPGRALVGYLLRRQGSNTQRLESAITRIESMLGCKSLWEIYDAIMAVQQKSALPAAERSLIAGAQLHSTVREWYPAYSWDALAGRTLPEKLAAIDMITFLRDDVLVKVDRGTMAYSLEARSPLLDHRIVEFGTSLPAEFKSIPGTQKRILRDAVSRRLGGNIGALRKMGFATPLPEMLPPGPDPEARWNIFIEGEWRTRFGQCNE